MKKRKGFTLIELLAVIVVLSIIALIAVPIVLNIIEDARIGAAETSAKNYIKAVETYVVSSELNKKDILLKNNKYNVTKSTTIDDKTYQAINDLVDIKGTKPNGSEDYITLGDTYQVTESKLTINGYEIFLKNDNVVSITKNGNIIKGTLLADLVDVGDYVAYDAGTWTSSVGLPTSQGEFGGYTAGENKASSVGWCYDSKYPTSLKGWRVLSVDKNTKTVTIVHAGHSECYYHAKSYNDASITNLNNHVASEYLNDDYASSAHMMTYEEALAITGSTAVTTNNLRSIGSAYWLASQFSTASLYCVSSTGSTYCGHYDKMLGIRPVILLKSNIKTTGKTTDAVGNDAWNLIAP